MDFQFHPWERLSPDVADGEAHERLTVEGRAWLFRNCGGLWWAREEQQADGEWNFALRAIPIAASSLGTVWLFPERSNLARFVGDEWHAQTLGRVWALDAALFVGWKQDNGWALFQILDSFVGGEEGAALGFKVPDPLEIPSSAMFARLQSQWEDADSDLRFAAYFATSSKLERALHSVETRIETPRAFAHLVEQTLRAFEAQWPSNALAMQLTFGPNSRDARFLLEEKHPFGIRERAILGHIVRAFEPRCVPDSPATPAALRAYRNGYSTSFSVEVARPSQHERLEAMLELRAWLEAHWPDGVRHLGKVV